MANKDIVLGLPYKMEFHHHGGYIEIVRIWSGLENLFLTVFVIIWNSFLVFMVGKIEGDTLLLHKLMLLMLMTVGVCLTYRAVAGWFNRTHIFVRNGKIAVRHKPIPWINKEIETSDLKQLYVEEVISHERGAPDQTLGYDVIAITHSGLHIRLVDPLEKREQALFIEREIEKFLNIADEPVEEEVAALRVTRHYT